MKLIEHIFPSRDEITGGIEHVRGSVSDLSLLAGATAIFFMFSILLISVFLFAFRISLSWFHIPLSSFATVLFCYAAVRHYFPQNAGEKALAVILLLSLFFILFLYVCGNVYDLSYDGQSYQQEAIIQLKEGWNPLYNPVIGSVATFYTKGQWIYEAALYCLTGNLEQAKVFNFLWIAASFFLSLAALLRMKRIKYGLAVALALLFACNPVCIYQSLTFYVDGQLASSLTSLLAVSCLLLTRSDKFILVIYFMVLAIGINLKLPFIAYAGTFGIGLLLYLFMAGKRKTMLPVAATGLLAFVVGTCLVGFNPYAQNLMKHGNPFYPFIGPKAVDYMGSKDAPGNRPANFNAMNRFERLFHANFSETSNACLTASSSPKWPFAVKKSELNYNWMGDARVGGFGPLFGGAIIMTTIILLGALVARSPGAGYGAGIILAIVLSVLLHRDGWWARYAPQLYVVPLIAVILSGEMRSRMGRFGGYLLIAILAANLLLVSWPYFRFAYASSKNLAQQLRHLSSKPGPVYAHFSYFIPYRIRLRDAGITYIQVKSASELPCRFPEAVGSILVCPEAPKGESTAGPGVNGP